MENIRLKDKLMVYFPYGYLDRNIASRDDIYKIVSIDSYKDMAPRNLKGIGNYPNEKKEIFNFITDQFVTYFNSSAKNKEEFETWHKNLCEEICIRFSALPGIELKYGKAQKMVNMTFKQLYCFGDSYDREKYFEHCHIPIDSNVILWCKNIAGITPPPTAWSNLSYNDYTNFEESLNAWLNSEKNTEYRNDDGTPYSLMQLDFIAWISVPKTRIGIIDKWRENIQAEKLWKPYKEMAFSLFPELNE